MKSKMQNWGEISGQNQLRNDTENVLKRESKRHKNYLVTLYYFMLKGNRKLGLSRVVF